MEVQCPFRVQFESLAANTTFADWLLHKINRYGKSIALV